LGGEREEREQKSGVEGKTQERRRGKRCGGTDGTDEKGKGVNKTHSFTHNLKIVTADKTQILSV